MNRNEKCLIRWRNLFIYLFSFASTKNVHNTSTTIHIHETEQGQHNSLHQVLWALIHQSKRLSPLRWILVQDIHVKELVNALPKVVGFLPQGMLTGWVGIEP